MKNKLLILSLVFSFYSCLVISQTKNEKEERIKLSELPNSVREIVGTLPKKIKRLKFYKETDGRKNSFEIKLKYQKNSFSIEFSEYGELEDIEVLSKLKAIDIDARIKIKRYFENSFSKHKFIKIQKQYLPTSDTEASVFVEGILSKKIISPSNFEIITEITTPDKRELREFTFNHIGIFQSFRVVNPSTYDYVLY
ncbi:MULTISPECIES: hypothetical protein [unclassified Winogradskyella]|uniref:hypothetical protein n=1 Tax=unclassified Winogradskyella TaxID=2615021 RepID=UPI00122B71F1|nr:MULTISPECIES: hypothetical protein [unclassified Winogradskyella]RZN75349.1 MAG: hypothetical protein EVB12_07380 [Winogradskyella sp.]